MAWNLNLETITMDALSALLEVDRKFRGTDDYMGLAYFWAHDYKHYLRDASIAKRRVVHKKLLEEGLEVTVVSSRHEYIVVSICKPEELK